MFIQTETTPNPLTLKFMPGVDVLKDSTAFFTDKEMAEKSPLATALFMVEGVTAIFFSGDFITVTKKEEMEWDVMKPMLLTTISEHFVAGLPVLHESKPAKKADAEEDTEIVSQIKELIETRVRPAVAQDGGDIIFHSFKDGIVHLEMHGACAGCPSSTMTLKNGIENMLKHYVPEVQAVEPVM
jgi:Fe-S cluster biogenesis protein NfuA